MNAPQKPKNGKVAKKPRYLELADELRSAILLGKFGGEETFPTESVLCKQYEVSRFTVREALRKLTSEGLIARKRGSGTVIQPATARAGALHQPLSNVGEILQYARDTSISFEKRGLADITADVAAQIGIEPGGQWFLFYGVRKKEGRRRAIAVTDAWVHPDLADAAEKIDNHIPTIFGQLEENSGVKVASITQDIQAVAASRDIADALELDKGDPVLRILRSYYDDSGRIFEISASYHPGGRFAYSMHIEADG